MASTRAMERGEDPREEQDEATELDEKGPWLQARYLVVFAAFLVNAVCFIMRVNLSVAIVAIALDPDSRNVTAKEGPQYDWDAATRGTILSSFFWGYIVTQIPASYLVQRYGPRIMFLGTMVICTAATFLFVPASALGWQYACASRVILGLAQGAMMSSSHTLLARWSPPDERARMAVYTYSGHLFGTVVALSGSGLLSATDIGWPLVFYVSGALGALSVIVWFFLAADSPSQSRFASPQEIKYIETSINIAGGTSIQRDNAQVPLAPGTKESEKPPNSPLSIPWVSILTSPPMIALTIVHCAQAWGFWTLLTIIPSYMNGVLNFDLAKNGLLSSLPYLTMWGAGLVFSWIGDWMLKRGSWTVATSRKVGNSIGHYGSAIALVVLGYAGTNETAAVTILTVAVGINAGTMIGYQVNHIDLSPNFAGTMMAITNCTANVMSILGPLVAGFIVVENDNASQWRIVFLIAAGFFIIGNTIFVVFGRGNVQPWNNPEYRRAKRVH